MPHFNLVLLGFGNVGQALAGLLLKKRQQIAEQYGIRFQVTGIATSRRGVLTNPHGIDLQSALDQVAAGQALSLSTMPAVSEYLRAAQAQVVFETIPVNYESGQPAVDYLRAALELGMHAISANKGPVVHAYELLSTLAATKGVKYYFESAVMDGAPVFSLVREALPGVVIHSFHGVLNSTTNLILDRMEMGEDFEDAVSYAQAVGLAETDPMGDLDGWDAAVKVAALCTVVLGVPTKPQRVSRTGMLGITRQAVLQAQAEGKRWKLVCSARRQGEGVQAQVAPEMVGPESPLYNVGGASSMITFETDILPGLSITESAPSPETTAYGLLADFLNAVRQK
ncbi:MAG: homoserine dehydrogenase [Chloroflexota bacterium]